MFISNGKKCVIIGNRRVEIMEAYQRVGKLSSLYDGMMTNTGLLGKLAIRYFWQLSDEKYLEFINQAFAGIPKDFDGSLLEVPIGTGVLSLPVYKNLQAAEIIGVDYAQSMLNAARANAQKLNLSKIKLIQGDVGNLPFESEIFDIVLSIDGFHVFPNKSAAYNETYRVLRNGGTFCGCMYIKDQNRRTDFFVKNFCERFGYFTSPYETLESLNERLNGMYSQVEITHVESFAGFVCRK